MKIKAATKKDFDKINELDEKICLYEKKFDPLIRVGKFEKKNVKEIFKFKDKKAFLAVENNKVVGHIIGWMEKRKLYNNINVGFICDIFVERKFRNKGIGGALMKEMMKWFKKKGARYEELHVYTGNKKAQKLYKQAGFKEYDKVMRLKI